jgi:hypothetical protein
VGADINKLSVDLVRNSEIEVKRKSPNLSKKYSVLKTSEYYLKEEDDYSFSIYMN